MLFSCALPQDVKAVQGSVPNEQLGVTNSTTGEPALQLDDVVSETLRKNPEAQSALDAVEALKRHVPQVKTLPDSVVSVGWAGNIVPFSLQ